MVSRHSDQLVRPRISLVRFSALIIIEALLQRPSKLHHSCTLFLQAAITYLYRHFLKHVVLIIGDRMRKFVLGHGFYAFVRHPVKIAHLHQALQSHVPSSLFLVLEYMFILVLNLNLILLDLFKGWCQMIETGCPMVVSVDHARFLLLSL